MGKCKWCGKEAQLHTHHLIPRWCGGLEGDKMEVCNSCHRKLDARFDVFIKYGSFHAERWHNKDKELRFRRDYWKKYQARRVLHSFIVEYSVRIVTMLIYNRKTDFPRIYTTHYYQKPRQRCYSKQLHSHTPISGIHVVTYVSYYPPTDHVGVYNRIDYRRKKRRTMQLSMGYYQKLPPLISR